MTPRPGLSRRRRALLLLGLALLLGGLAAADVSGREAALDRRLAPLVPVVVARTALPAGAPIAPGAVTVRHVPARFAPREAYGAPADVAGRRPGADIPTGADVTEPALGAAEGSPGAAGAPVRRGERVAEVLATGSAELVVAGARVDVLVTREQGPGARGGTRLALEDVEVLGASRAPGGEDAGPRVAASLRVSVRQAVFLAAAQSFAREVRLLPRAAGDRGRSGPGIAYDQALG